MESQSKNILLTDDIDRIKKGHDASRNTASYSGIVHLEKEDIDLKGFLISVEINRNFNGSVIDRINIDFLIENGTYYKKILPEKDTLFVTLTKHEGVRTRSTTYKLVIVNNTQGDTGSYSQHASEESLNKGGMKRVLAQAVDIVWYGTRLINNSFTLRGVTIEKAMIASFNDFISNTRNIKINGRQLEIDKFNFDTPINENFYNNVTIGSNVTMYDVPTHLQKEYGVYNGNIGTYISKEYNTGDEQNLKDSIYIYPLYSPLTVKNRKRKMRLYAEKGVLNKFIDATFVNSENSLDILCSAENASKQIFTQYSADSGAGFSMVDANYITKENKTENDRDNVFLQQSYNKKDGVSPTRHAGVTSNPFQARSDILLKAGTTISINWNFSIQELVSPGMAVEYIYEIDKDGKPSIEVLDGIVQAIYTNVDNNQKNSKSVVTVFLHNKNLN